MPTIDVITNNFLDWSTASGSFLRIKYKADINSYLFCFNNLQFWHITQTSACFSVKISSSLAIFYTTLACTICQPFIYEHRTTSEATKWINSTHMNALYRNIIWKLKHFMKLHAEIYAFVLRLRRRRWRQRRRLRRNMQHM